MSDTPEQITAKALSEHRITVAPIRSWPRTFICSCGQWRVQDDEGYEQGVTHQAAMVLAAQREAAAENNDLIRRADEALRRWENSGHAGDLHALPNIVFELIQALAAAEAAEGAQR